MKYDINESIAILERTPAVLHSLLSGLPGCWTQATEGGESWSAYDILGHLIHGERTDWIERTQRILEHGESKPFEPFDRFAQYADSQDKSLDQLLEEFAALRTQDVVSRLRSFRRLGIRRQGRAGQAALTRPFVAGPDLHDVALESSFSRLVQAGWRRRARRGRSGRRTAGSGRRAAGSGWRRPGRRPAAACRRR